MSQTRTPTAHIRLDDQGRAWIDDSNIKVIEVVQDHLAWGWSADEIHQQHGGNLSLAQIHAALSYYYDHEAEYNAELARMDQEYQAAWEAQGKDTPLHRRLRAKGLIP
jgi:uncharacterized protein (DUF433 family)